MGHRPIRTFCDAFEYAFMRTGAWLWLRGALAVETVGLPRWKYHIGHAGTGAGLAALLASIQLCLGHPVNWSLSLGLGSVGLPLLKEAYDFQKNPTTEKALDGVADLVQYQLLAWPLAFLSQRQPVAALESVIAFLALYLITLPWSDGHP